MKYGAHSYIFTDRWADDRLPILDAARGLGLDLVEIAVGDDVRFSPGLTRRRAESLGLELAVSPGGLWPVECDLSADDPDHRARGLAWHERQVDLAAEMGAVAYAGALYGHPGVVLRRRPPADEQPRTAEGLHRLAEYGARRGVKIVLEPMSHFRSHVVNTPDQCLHLVAMADHPNLGVLFDTYHMLTEVRDYAAAVRLLGSRLWGVHACENDRGIPGGGLVPWEALFAGLRAAGFSGYMILEAYNSSIGDFAFERGMFHNVCPNAQVFVHEGLEFLRGLAGRG